MWKHHSQADLQKCALLATTLQCLLLQMRVAHIWIAPAGSCSVVAIVQIPSSLQLPVAASVFVSHRFLIRWFSTRSVDQVRCRLGIRVHMVHAHMHTSVGFVTLRQLKFRVVAVD